MAASAGNGLEEAEIGFTIADDRNAQIIKKIEIIDPAGEKMQRVKDLDKIYAENTKVITSYDELIFEKEDKDGTYKFKIIVKDKLNDGVCSKEIYFSLK